MKVTTKKILEFLIALFLVLNCNTVYQRLAYHNLRIEEITALLSVAFFIERLAYGRRFLPPRFFIKLLLVFLASLVYFVGTFSEGFSKIYMYQFLVFLPCIIICCSSEISEQSGLNIYKIFSDIVYYTSIVSTVLWVFSAVIPLFGMNMTTFIEWGGIREANGIFGIFFRFQKDETFGIDLYRNSGFYTEGPMLSLVLTLALMYEAFFEKKPSKKRMVIISLMILTTISLSGFIMILVIAFLKWWEKIFRKKKSSIIYLMLFILIVPGMLLVAEAVISVKSSTASYSTRMIDYLVGIKAFIDYPLFGVGYNKLTKFMVYKQALLLKAGRGFRNVGYSNGLFAILGQGGIVLSLVYLFPCVYVLIKKKFGLNMKEWMISYLLLLAVTIFHARFISIFFLGMFYAAIFSGKSFSDRREAV